jgi:hypothetical protein
VSRLAGRAGGRVGLRTSGRRGEADCSWRGVAVGVAASAGQGQGRWVGREAAGQLRGRGASRLARGRGALGCWRPLGGSWRGGGRAAAGASRQGRSVPGPALEARPEVMRGM